MELSEAQKHVITEWVDEHDYLLKPCPVCQSDEGYSTGDIIAPPMVDAYGKVLHGMFANPLITFECGTCGNVLVFRASRIPGLL